MATWQRQVLILMAALTVFVLFCVLQMPAAWLVAKYAPNAPLVQVSGNALSGQGIWQIPSTKPITGDVAWRMNAQGLLTGTPFALQIGQGESKLNADFGSSNTGFRLKNMSGRVMPSTMQAMGDIYSEAPLVLNSSDFALKKGELYADGQATMAAGKLFYRYQGQAGEADLPMMTATIKDNPEQTAAVIDVEAGGGQLIKGQITPTQIELGLTQRFMQHFAVYQGQAPEDEIVINYARAWR